VTVKREQLDAIKQQFFLLAMDIGLNPAARAMGPAFKGPS